MDACRNERLLDQGIQVPENVSRAIPDWVFPNGTGTSARYQSRPDAVFVHSIPGRPSHINPTKIPPHDRDMHLVGFKFCPDTSPSHSQSCNCPSCQHVNKLITRSSRNPRRNNKVALHIILVGVAGTIYNNCTNKPFINLGLTKHKAKSLASKLDCHAI
eukprot:810859-Pelagomonas_calceolata.AAC.1